VLLISHGALAGDAARRFIGQTDLPMSEAGEAQIQALAAELAGRVKLDAIYCSDLNRSRRTAELLANTRTTPVYVSAALREINLGEWEGLYRRDVAQSQPDAYRRRGEDIVNFRPPGAENFAAVASRVLPFWRSLTDGAGAKEEREMIAVAAHAGVNRVILCDVLGMPLDNLFRLSQRPGCLNVIECGREGPTVRLLDATSM
jgi:probable phosphoglycerate mutase